MYRSRKATAVFQHTNPLKEEIFEQVTSIKVKSTNKGIYPAQNLKEKDDYISPWDFHSAFYPTAHLGEKGQGGVEQVSNAAVTSQAPLTLSCAQHTPQEPLCSL